MRRLPAAGALAALLAAGCGGGDDNSAAPLPKAALTLAVIGDTPYGDRQVVRFPSDLGALAREREVAAVLHLGDIQAGPTRCDDRYLTRIRRQFDAIHKPVIYTPGDNEWTDCHVPAKGAQSPVSRLRRIREIFFDRPGRTRGGRPLRVASQRAPVVENARWRQAGVVLTTLHVPGSNNGSVPWSGTGAPAQQQVDENRARMAANLAWLDRAFDIATARRAIGVVVAMQADMWPLPGSPQEVTAYRPIVDRLARRARAFRRPVLVLQGDSHLFRRDTPLRRGSPMHEVRTAAPNVQRIVVQGAESEPHEWLRLNVYPRRRGLFGVERLPF